MLLDACLQNNIDAVQKELVKLAKRPDDIINQFESQWIPALKLVSDPRKSINPLILQELNAFGQKFPFYVAQQIFRKFFFLVAHNNLQLARDYLDYGFFKHQYDELKKMVERLLRSNPEAAFWLFTNIDLKAEESAVWAHEMMTKIFNNVIPPSDFSAIILEKLVQPLSMQEFNLLLIQLFEKKVLQSITPEQTKEINDDLTRIFKQIAKFPFLGFTIRSFFNSSTFTIVNLQKLIQERPENWPRVASSTLNEKLHQKENQAALELLILQYRYKQAFDVDCICISYINEILNNTFCHLSDPIFLNYLSHEDWLQAFLQTQLPPSILPRLNMPFSKSNQEMEIIVAEVHKDLHKKLPSLYDLTNKTIISVYVMFQLKWANFLHLDAVLNPRPQYSPLLFSELRRRKDLFRDKGQHVKTQHVDSLLEELDTLSLQSDTDANLKGMETATMPEYQLHRPVRRSLARSQ